MDHGGDGDVSSDRSTDDERQWEEDELNSAAAMLDQAHRAKLRKMNTPDKVLDYLYLGDKRLGGSVTLLTEYKITHVLNVHHSCRFPPASAPYKFCHVPVDDYGLSELSSASCDVLKRCFKFIEQARVGNGRVFVHCRKGINRSPTIVLAWLVYHEGWTLKKAYEHVKQVRPMMSPHERYFEQLQELDKEKHGTISVTREDVGPSLQQQLRDIRQEYILEQQAKQALIDAGLARPSVDELPESPRESTELELGPADCDLATDDRGLGLELTETAPHLAP